MSKLLESQPASVQTALEAEAVDMVLLVKLSFASSTLYVSNTNTQFTDGNGQTWKGMGDLIGISNLQGGPDDLSPYVEYSLGIPWEILTAEEQASAQFRIPSLLSDRSEFMNRDAVLYAQLRDLDTRAPIGTPFALDYSRMDKVEASFTATDVKFTLTCTSLMARKGAPIYGLLTDRDQQKRHPGDNGLAFVPEVASTEVQWTDW